MTQTSEETSLSDKSRPVDMRPESSPYASPLVTLQFADGQPFYVHARLMEKSPKLLSCTRGVTGGFGHSKTPNYKHIPGSVGHVIVHYLFTGTYECLKPNGSSRNEKDTAEFTTSVRVYAFARDFELSELEKLSQVEMERLGNRLEVMQIFDVLSNTLQKVSVDDMWLQSYLKSLVRSSLIDNSPTQLDTPSAGAQQTMSIANAVFKVTTELWRDHTKLLDSKLHDPSPNQDYNDKLATAYAEVDPGLNLEHHPTNALGEASVHVDVDTNAKYVEGHGGEIEEEGNKRKKKSKKELMKEKKKKRMEKINGAETTEQRSEYEAKPQLEAQEQFDNSILAFKASSIQSTSQPEASPSAEASRLTQQNSPADNAAQPKTTSLPSKDDIESLFGPQTSSGSSFANTHGSTVLNPLRLLSEGMIDVPLTTGAEVYLEIEQPNEDTIIRLQHVCAQEKYQNYSPEELRWKHEFVIGISAFEAK